MTLILAVASLPTCHAHSSYYVQNSENTSPMPPAPGGLPICPLGLVLVAESISLWPHLLIDYLKEQGACENSLKRHLVI